jgi:4-hydroxy-tetrahydrodipicolinate synthase
MEGLLSVLPTAFHDGGALDLAGTVALARAHVEDGAAGLTVLGVMGEAAEMTEAERLEVLGCVVTDVGAPVVVGVTGTSADMVEGRARDAARIGATALMVSPSGGLGLRAAVAAAAAGGLPIVIQDYPAGSGVTVTAAEMGAVADAEPLVAGVKAEAPPTSGTIATLRAGWPRLGVMGGLGGLFLLDELRAGATGVMTGFALPGRLVSIVQRFPGDPTGAEQEWLRLLPLMRLEAFQPFALAARKEVWRLRGVIGSSFCRRPGASLDDRGRDDVRRSLDAVQGPNAVR